MGQACSSSVCSHTEPDPNELSRKDTIDPLMFDLMRRSIQATTPKHSGNNNNNSSNSSYSNPYNIGKRKPPGQHHLLYRNSKFDTTSGGGGPVPLGAEDNSSDPNNNNTAATAATNTAMDNDCSNSNSNSKANPLLDPSFWLPEDTPVHCPTRLMIRRRSRRVTDDGGETHIYALRYPADSQDKIVSEQVAPRPESARQEQCPPKKMAVNSSGSIARTTITGDNHSVAGKSKSKTSSGKVSAAANGAATITQSQVLAASLLEGAEIFSAGAMASRPKQGDVGLTAMQCDHIVNTTEQVCRGQYAAYTYAKQTLGCREYPSLAQASFSPVHTTTSEIMKRLGVRKPEQQLQLDDREPHIVKYDVTKKERQKLDMHTDKSEWTFLIALSNGCGVDYDGGGTYFECLDATVHIQRGHALIFPGKLRHCGQKITTGLRFLLVGFLVDKANNIKISSNSNNAQNANHRGNNTNTSLAPAMGSSSDSVAPPPPDKD